MPGLGRDCDGGQAGGERRRREGAAGATRAQASRAQNKEGNGLSGMPSGLSGMPIGYAVPDTRYRFAYETKCFERARERSRRRRSER